MSEEYEQLLIWKDTQSQPRDKLKAFKKLQKMWDFARFKEACARDYEAIVKSCFSILTRPPNKTFFSGVKPLEAVLESLECLSIVLSKISNQTIYACFKANQKSFLTLFYVGCDQTILYRKEIYQIFIAILEALGCQKVVNEELNFLFYFYHNNFSTESCEKLLCNASTLNDIFECSNFSELEKILKISEQKVKTRTSFEQELIEVIQKTKCIDCWFIILYKVWFQKLLPNKNYFIESEICSSLSIQVQSGSTLRQQLAQLDYLDKNQQDDMMRMLIEIIERREQKLNTAQPDELSIKIIEIVFYSFESSFKNSLKSSNIDFMKRVSTIWTKILDKTKLFYLSAESNHSLYKLVIRQLFSSIKLVYINQQNDFQNLKGYMEKLWKITAPCINTLREIVLVTPELSTEIVNCSCRILSENKDFFKECADGIEVVFKPLISLIHHISFQNNNLSLWNDFMRIFIQYSDISNILDYVLNLSYNNFFKMYEEISSLSETFTLKYKIKSLSKNFDNKPEHYLFLILLLMNKQYEQTYKNNTLLFQFNYTIDDYLEIELEENYYEEWNTLLKQENVLVSKLVKSYRAMMCTIVSILDLRLITSVSQINNCLEILIHKILDIISTILICNSEGEIQTTFLKTNKETKKLPIFCHKIFLEKLFDCMIIEINTLSNSEITLQSSTMLKIFQISMINIIKGSHEDEIDLICESQSNAFFFQFLHNTLSSSEEFFEIKFPTVLACIMTSLNLFTQDNSVMKSLIPTYYHHIEYFLNDANLFVDNSKENFNNAIKTLLIKIGDIVEKVIFIENNDLSFKECFETLFLKFLSILFYQCKQYNKFPVIKTKNFQTILSTTPKFITFNTLNDIRNDIIAKLSHQTIRQSSSNLAEWQSDKIMASPNRLMKQTYLTLLQLVIIDCIETLSTSTKNTISARALDNIFKKIFFSARMQSKPVTQLSDQIIESSVMSFYLIEGLVYLCEPSLRSFEHYDLLKFVIENLISSAKILHAYIFEVNSTLIEAMKKACFECLIQILVWVNLNPYIIFNKEILKSSGQTFGDAIISLIDLYEETKINSEEEIFSNDILFFTEKLLSDILGPYARTKNSKSILNEHVLENWDEINQKMEVASKDQFKIDIEHIEEDIEMLFIGNLSKDKRGHSLINFPVIKEGGVMTTDYISKNEKFKIYKEIMELSGVKNSYDPSKFSNLNNFINYLNFSLTHDQWDFPLNNYIFLSLKNSTLISLVKGKHDEMKIIIRDCNGKSCFLITKNYKTLSEKNVNIKKSSEKLSEILLHINEETQKEPPFHQASKDQIKNIISNQQLEMPKNFILAKPSQTELILLGSSGSYPQPKQSPTISQDIPDISSTQELNFEIFQNDHTFDCARNLLVSFGILNKKNLDYVDIIDSSQELLSNSLAQLDQIMPNELIKAAVLLVRPGQRKENEILMNDIHGASQFLQFIDNIGGRVELKSHFQFSGNLKAPQSGTETIYYSNPFVEIIFHVGPLIPTTQDPQQVYKKKFVGNDYVCIIWSENELQFRINTINSQFVAYLIIIYPLKNNLFKIEIQRRRNVNTFVPWLDKICLNYCDMVKTVRLLIIQANRCATINNDRRGYLSRLREIQKIINQFKLRQNNLQEKYKCSQEQFKLNKIIEFLFKEQKQLRFLC